MKVKTLNKIKEAYNKGYRIDKEGDAIGLRGDVLKGGIGGRGYLYKNISFRNKNGKSVKINIHHFQAFMKFGDKILNYDCVRHIDGNSLNNSWDNIELGSNSDNMLDKPLMLRRKIASNANKKHNHKQIVEDRKNGMTYKEIMKKHNISSKGTISYIINKAMALET